MTDLGRYLRAWRQQSEKTLKELAGDGFSQQVLSNYEIGVSLPRRDQLETLADRYGIPLNEVESRYFSSLTQIAAGPIREAPFLDSIQTIGSGDHLVVVTQRPLVGEKPELAANTCKLLMSGGCFTYVAYIPVSAHSADNEDHSSSGIPGAVEPWDNRWQDHHRYAAQILHRELRKNKTPSDVAGRLKYLLIGNPDKNDLSFLRADGASLYLSRPEKSENLESQSFSEMRGPDMQHWWHPYDPGFQLLLHDWLVFSCGLELPTSSVDEFTPNHEIRKLRTLTLEEFLKAH